MKKWLVWIGKKLLWVAAIFIVLSAVLLGVARLATPWLQNHREELAVKISETIHIPVKIGHLDIAWRRLSPVLALENVELLSVDQKTPLLKIERLFVDLDLLSSLFHWQLTPGRVVVSGTHLTVIRDAKGNYDVEDIEAIFPKDDGTPMGTQGLLLGLLAQPYLAAHNVILDLYDEDGELINVVNVHITIQNNNTHHYFKGRVELGEENPEIVRFVLNMNGKVQANDLSNMQGRFYVQGKRVLLIHWLALHPIADFKARGRADFTLQGEIKQNRINSLHGDFSLRDLFINGVHFIDYAAGQFNWLMGSKGDWTLTGKKVALIFNGIRWPENKFSIKWGADSPTSKNIHADVDYLRLQDITYFILRAKDHFNKLNLISDATVDAIKKIAPMGELHGLGLEYQQSEDARTQYALSLHFSDLGFKPWKTIPGVSGLSGSVQADGKGGRIILNSQSSTITLPDLFRKALPFDKLTMDAIWQRDDKGWRIDIPETQWSNAIGQGRSKVTLDIPTAGSSIINMLGEIHLQKLSNNDISTYLPVGILSTDLTKWLDSAVRGVNSLNANLVLKGALADYPFDNNNGTFLITADVAGLDLDYAPSWPRATGLAGNLVFAGRSMEAKMKQGVLANIPLQSLQVTIPHISDDAPVTLSLNGVAKGDLVDGFKFIKSSPLNETLGHELAGVQAKGPMVLSLQLTIPLVTATDLATDAAKKSPVAKGAAPAVKKPAVADDTVRVQGLVSMNNALLNIPSWDFTASNVNGDLHFTEDGLTAEKITAKIYGESAVANAVTKTVNGKAQTTIGLRGSVDMNEVQRQLQLPLSTLLQGQAAYQAELRLYKKGETSFHISTDLKGVSLQLPKPLGKDATLAVPSTLVARWDPKNNATVQFNYGQRLNGLFYWADNNKKSQFSQGRLNFGPEIAELPSTPGLIISGNLDRVSFDEWLNAFSLNQGGKNTAKLDSNLSFLQKIDLTLEHFTIADFDFKQLNMQISRLTQAWKIVLTSSPIKGMVTLPDNMQQRPVDAHFERLYLPVSLASNNKSAISVDKLPALNFTSDDFRHEGRQLGKVVLILSRYKGGVHIDELRADTSSFNLKAGGSWGVKNKVEYSDLKGRIKSKDVQKTLKEWDIPASIHAKNGQVDFDLAWLGSLFDPAFVQLAGKVKLQVKQGWIEGLGQGTDTKVGFGRLLNILSISSLPKRLQLNFSDLTHKGFDFETINGDFSLREGSAYTTNARVEGSVADIDIHGRIGLASRDYNVRFTVVPNLTSSLPMVATLAGGPIAGALTWAADKMLGSQVNKISSSIYQVTGPWEKPVVKPVKSGGEEG